MFSTSPKPMDSLIALSPVIPVVKVPSADAAVEVARALLRGGVRIIELTLRTPAGMDAIRAIASDVPEMAVGAGTVTKPEQVNGALDAGAQFIVTPGAPAELVRAVHATGAPALLGAGTVSEMMALANAGWKTLKFFPAEAAGGTKYLSSVRGPLPDIQFCPTGGINLKNAPDYLALPNVPCVGGSWLTPDAAIQAGDWGVIEGLAADMMAVLAPRANA
ncbi:bifunctional 4-hydroxy-2-oxoglutarate aldolase/2-dehydro-3-deoxy-phosphogluconate aldolase [uncultured Tessaracoccus sp.]|uniref:bifunctional 4-hydroxy-2-oxoglutarate aldolase/2-dehydro-3-deoxy-phosphogluconate aldolase n=1 Tax=uncultured Tessaracoccus sp. TaxID=905023 RepID=UPI002631D3B3|nr:bifunctional 4-hydroxy-2-oxoglutarate aldolase/2-dehydro-3-deoxy-phosphogluconate aldolase [uncultured Tessaracoccus sp.]